MIEAHRESIIKPLPSHLINQIKAGEVIENPSNVVKELLENSIDAGADEITIKIKDSGLSSILISDNGVGMGLNDLKLAFKRHATSKIKSFADLYQLHSYGFRGEALASIASISKIKCSSNPKNKKLKGGVIEFEGDGKKELIEIEQNENNGTTFLIKDLFFNTPVRLKFSKNQSLEKRKINSIIEAFILCYPNVKFNVTLNDDTPTIYHSIKSKKTQDIFSRLFTQKNILNEAEEVKAQYGDYYIKGVILNGHGSAKKHYFFVNNRMVHDVKIKKIITNTISSINGVPFSGSYCFFLNLPLSELDVNVHPHKTKVAYEKPDIVYSLVKSAIKKSISQKICDLDKKLANVTENDLNFDLKDNSSEKNQKDQSFYNFKKYIILSSLENVLVINKKSCFNSMIANQNQDKIPLLINSPFSSHKNNEKINFLKKINFEIEKISNDSYILTSVPESFFYLDLKKLLESFFKNFNSSNIKEDFYSSIDLSLTNSFFNSNVFKNKILNEIENKKILDDSTLEILFNHDH